MPEEPRSRSWPVAAGLLLALYAILAFVAASSKLAADDAWARAEATLASREFAEAEHAIAGLVAKEPMASEHLGMLGAAQLGAGGRDAAQQAFRAGAAVGWRDPATQLYWYAEALRREDWRQAALRADAVLRVRPHDGQMQALLVPLEASASGRSALAQRLAARPRWASRYLRTLGDLSTAQLAARAQTVLNIKGSLGCEAVAALSSALSQTEQRSLGDAISRQHCNEQQ